MKFFLVSMLVLWFLAGCVSSKTMINTAAFVNSGVFVSQTYETIRQSILAKIDKFSQEDQKALYEVDSNLSATIKVLKQWEQLDNSTVSVSWVTIEDIYESSRINYFIAREIILKNPDKFSSITHIQLESFDRQASRLDRQYQLIEARPDLIDKGAFIADALNIGLTIGKIVVPILKEM